MYRTPDSCRLLVSRIPDSCRLPVSRIPDSHRLPVSPIPDSRRLPVSRTPDIQQNLIIIFINIFYKNYYLKIGTMTICDYPVFRILDSHSLPVSRILDSHSLPVSRILDSPSLLVSRIFVVCRCPGHRIVVFLVFTAFFTLQPIAIAFRAIIYQKSICLFYLLWKYFVYMF